MTNTELISKLKHLPDDRIGDDIYVAYEWVERELARVYIGSKTNGPMLQYHFIGTRYGDNSYTVKTKMGIHAINPSHFWDGEKSQNIVAGWTNLYSRGDFKRDYAYGGHWSSHTNNLLKVKQKEPKERQLLVDKDVIIPLPSGIQGEVQQLDIDCSGGWTIWFTTAKDALLNRLSKKEIEVSGLPEISKKHLSKNETSDVLQKLMEVIDAYNL